jgi:hypothetical protein
MKSCSVSKYRVIVLLVSPRIFKSCCRKRTSTRNVKEETFFVSWHNVHGHKNICGFTNKLIVLYSKLLWSKQLVRLWTTQARKVWRLLLKINFRSLLRECLQRERERATSENKWSHEDWRLRLLQCKLHVRVVFISSPLLADLDVCVHTQWRSFGRGGQVVLPPLAADCRWRQNGCTMNMLSNKKRVRGG